MKCYKGFILSVNAKDEVFLPLTFITGLYGMNVQLPLQDYAWAFWAIMGFMALVAAGFYIYFRHKKMM